MAPEQARGKPVDRRADIWAFGVVLFEMLTGKRLFDGETVSDVLAAVLTREVDFGLLPPSTPPAVANVLRRCLARDPRERLSWIGEARHLLREAPSARRARHRDASPSAPPPAGGASLGGRRGPRGGAPLLRFARAPPRTSSPPSSFLRRAPPST